MDDQSIGHGNDEMVRTFFLFPVGSYKEPSKMLLKKTNQQQFSIIYNLIYGGTPIIRSQMGKKEFGRIIGAGGQIS